MERAGLERTSPRGPARLSGSLRADPKVKGTGRLLSPGGWELFLRELRSAVAIGPPESIAVVKQRFGQRAVLRVTAAPDETSEPSLAEDAGGPDGGARAHDRMGRHRDVYVKLLRSRDASRMQPLLLLAAEAKRIGVHIPAPLAWLPRFRAMVFEAAYGRPLLPCCAPRDAEAAPESPHAEPPVYSRIGSALASLHRVLPLAGKRADRITEIVRVLKAGEIMIRWRPDLLPRFDAVVAELRKAGRSPADEGSSADAPTAIIWPATAVRAMPEHGGGESGGGSEGAIPKDRGTAVTLHGDFYPAQVLFTPRESAEPEVAFLDWDETCTGEAARDVANFLGHLTLDAIRGHISRGEAAAMTDAFLGGYRQLRPLDAEAFHWYLRATLLRLAALHCDPAFGADPPNDPALAERLLEASARGPDDSQGDA